MGQSRKTDEDWESRCLRCGRCCYEKVEWQGDIYYTDVPCEYLDLHTRLCKVYDERIERRPGCLRLTRKLIHRGLLPADCPYAAGVAAYRAPLLWEDAE